MRLVSDQLWFLNNCVTPDRLLSLSECPSTPLGPGNNISREGTVESGPEAGLGQGLGNSQIPFSAYPAKGKEVTLIEHLLGTVAKLGQLECRGEQNKNCPTPANSR